MSKFEELKAEFYVAIDAAWVVYEAAREAARADYEAAYEAELNKHRELH
jgi:hypothetical protein